MPETIVTAPPDASAPLAVVALNLGGPDSLDAVEPFLRNLFGDPDVIQLGWARPLQPLFARLISKRRAPLSKAAYQQIGGRSPILAETTAQIEAVAARLTAQGVPAKGYVAMACWHPFPAEAVAAMQRDGIQRAIAVPLFPQYSFTTTASAMKALQRALTEARAEIRLADVRSYPAADGFVAAIADTITEAAATLPASMRETAPVLFSAHGLPESYIRKGDPYLDEVRTTVAAVSRRLALGTRARLSFQSRVGRQRWLGPYTEDSRRAGSRRREGRHRGAGRVHGRARRDAAGAGHHLPRARGRARPDPLRARPDRGHTTRVHRRARDAGARGGGGPRLGLRGKGTAPCASWSSAAASRG